jgi:hypothetical protein
MDYRPGCSGCDPLLKLDAITAAIVLLEGAGYCVTKPRARAPKAERPTLNAIGKPYSPQYDPNWKRRTPLTSITRLRAPMPSYTLWK